APASPHAPRCPAPARRGGALPARSPDLSGRPPEGRPARRRTLRDVPLRLGARQRSKGVRRGALDLDQLPPADRPLDRLPLELAARFPEAVERLELDDLTLRNALFQIVDAAGGFLEVALLLLVEPAEHRP